MLRGKRHVAVSRRSIHGDLSLADVACNQRTAPKCRLVRDLFATARVLSGNHTRVSSRGWTFCALADRGAPRASTSRRTRRASISHHAPARVPLSGPVSADRAHGSAGPETFAARAPCRWVDRRTACRSVAGDPRRIGTLHRASGPRLRVGGEDARRTPVVGGPVPGGSIR